MNLIFYLVFCIPTVAGNLERQSKSFDQYMQENQTANDMEIFVEPQTPDGKPSITTKNEKSNKKNRVFTLTKRCPAHASPSKNSEVVINLKKGAKVWLDTFDEKWKKAYRKEGEAFLPSDCIN